MKEIKKGKVSDDAAKPVQQLVAVDGMTLRVL